MDTLTKKGKKGMLYVLTASMLLLGGCSNADEPDYILEAGPRHEINITSNQKKSVSYVNKFAYDAWETLCEVAKDNNGNQFFSPLSLQFVLSMLANGGREEAVKEIASIYCEGNVSDGLNNLNSLCRLLKDELPLVDNTTTVGIANSMWCENSMRFSSNFEKVCKTVFDAESYKFSVSTEKARKDINQWCADNTSGMISEFLKDVPDSEAYIFNASYFKGRWKFPFPQGNTKKRDFYCEDGNKAKVSMMCLDDFSLQGIETEEMFHVEIPYGNEGFAMEIIMPKEGVNFNEKVTNLGAGSWSSKEKIIRAGQVKLHMPKFEVSAEYDISKLMSAMGYNSISDSFNDLIENKIVNMMVRQKARCVADENGTKAAAVTEAALVGAIGDGVPVNFELEINRPFFFTIKETSTGAILFMGKVARF